MRQETSKMKQEVIQRGNAEQRGGLNNKIQEALGRLS